MLGRTVFPLLLILVLSCLIAGCGPSNEDYDCVIHYLNQAKNSAPTPSDRVIEHLDKGIEAAKAHDVSALEDAFENARYHMLGTLAVGDHEHVSPEAALNVSKAMQCIDYCPAILKQKGECP